MIIVYVFAVFGALSFLLALFGFLGFLLSSNVRTSPKEQNTYDYNLTEIDVKRNRDTENDYSRMFQPFGEKEK